MHVSRILRRALAKIRKRIEEERRVVDAGAGPGESGDG
jgi:hypothetical protein